MFQQHSTPLHQENLKKKHNLILKSTPTLYILRIHSMKVIILPGPVLPLFKTKSHYISVDFLADCLHDGG